MLGIYKGSEPEHTVADQSVKVINTSLILRLVSIIRLQNRHLRYLLWPVQLLW